MPINRITAFAMAMRRETFAYLRSKTRRQEVMPHQQEQNELTE